LLLGYSCNIRKVENEEFRAKDGGGFAMPRYLKVIAKFLKGCLEIVLSSKEEEELKLHFWMGLV
jgi:hypothetical protein